MIVDTSALLAYFDRSEPDHEAVAQVLDASTEPLVISPYVVVETDYLVATRHGTVARAGCVGGAGQWCLGAAGIRGGRPGGRARLVERYADQSIGVADASLVVLAAQVPNEDHRHPRSPALRGRPAPRRWQVHNPADN